MPLIQQEARLQLLVLTSTNSLTTNRKDYNSIIMTFFKSTCYEDYLPYMTKGNDVVLVVNTTNLFGDEAGADDRNLDLFGDWDGGDIKYSFKYDIKEGTFRYRHDSGYTLERDVLYYG